MKYKVKKVYKDRGKLLGRHFRCETRTYACNSCAGLLIFNTEEEPECGYSYSDLGVLEPRFGEEGVNSAQISDINITISNAQNTL